MEISLLIEINCAKGMLGKNAKLENMFKSLIMGSMKEGNEMHEQLTFSLLFLIYTPLKMTSVMGLCDPKLEVSINTNPE